MASQSFAGSTNPKCPPRPHGVPLPQYGTPSGGISPPPSPPPTPHSFNGFSRTRVPKHKVNLGLIICLILFQTALVITRTDVFRPFMDIESAMRRASTENSTLVLEKGKSEHEREMMAHERELWERAKENRVPQGAWWEVVWPAWTCSDYGKREYWGILRNIPEGWSDADACMNMPVEIKGVTIRRPYRCARVWGSPHIHAYWMVDWDQPDCKPWYRDFHNAGCTNRGSGKRRIEAQIVGINGKGGQNWWSLCNATPLVWDMTTYKSPARCEERGPWGRKVAVWDVPDESCL